MLKIANSLSRALEDFEPLTEGEVRMYVCGITVYDYCHIGHARMLVVFDMVARYLREMGYQLTYVRNITDVDDKIIARAAENSEDPAALTERFIQAMDEDCEALGMIRPDHEPRATENVPQMLAMIERLIDKGLAYAADNGDVYYRVSRFDGYGRLSGKKLSDLRAGERVEVDENKEDPLDFVLWKAAKAGEPAWDSPWGAGRPGWHIECSAMATDILGESFDIHGGGMDLKFPHHENEIAQSCGANGADTFARYWMHNGFVQVDEEKMAKSLGNFVTIRQALESHRAEVLRYFILASHYRSPLNYSDQELRAAYNALDRLYTALRGVTPAETLEADLTQPYEARFQAAMLDDFNTPEAVAVLHELARERNRSREDGDRAAQLAAVLRRLGGVLGLLQQDPEAWCRGVGGGCALDDAEIEQLIAERQQARADRDFQQADAIRDQLAEAGVVLEDGAGGTTWRREG